MIRLTPACLCVQVTCGSTIKLQHIATKARLHSHQVAYSRGSQQQSVTGFPEGDDGNSLWLVQGTAVSRSHHHAQFAQGYVSRAPTLGMACCSTTIIDDKLVFRCMQDAPCVPGEPFRKGSKLRLLHVSTRKWLHSHQYYSPLSNNQEVRRSRIK